MAPAPTRSEVAAEEAVASAAVEVCDTLDLAVRWNCIANRDVLGGRGGFSRDMGPPATVLELGSFLHATEGEMVCESTNTKIPYFNAPIYLENKVIIGQTVNIGHIQHD